jgi:hypothetical protein
MRSTKCMYVFIDAVSYTESNSFIVCAVACDLLCPPDPSSILSQWWGGYPSCVLTRREGVAFPGPGRCVSIFLNQNRCHGGKSQPEQAAKKDATAAAAPAGTPSTSPRRRDRSHTHPRAAQNEAARWSTGPRHWGGGGQRRCQRAHTVMRHRAAVAVAHATLSTRRM